MYIEYFVSIVDSYGYDNCTGIFSCVEEAVEHAKDVESRMLDFLKTFGYKEENIDQYHLDNMGKRFGVLVEVVYE